jgi:hypothetical protein
MDRAPALLRLPDEGPVMSSTRFLLFLLPALAAPACAAPPGGLAGTWTQSSSGKELVLQSKIKLTPYAAPGYGTNLGGSVGYGSATSTVVTTEPVPMQVDRRMTLAIDNRGDFVWTIEKRQHEAGNCVRNIRQQKKGRASVVGDELVLNVQGGVEKQSGSCGAAKNASLPAAVEKYRVRMTGATMVLASGPVRWTWKKG